MVWLHLTSCIIPEDELNGYREDRVATFSFVTISFSAKMQTRIFFFVAPLYLVDLTGIPGNKETNSLGVCSIFGSLWCK
jgi:hypothetical protein